MVYGKFDKLKIIYYRSEKYDGDLAISGHKLDVEQFEKLLGETHNVGKKSFSFYKSAGEDL